MIQEGTTRHEQDRRWCRLVMANMERGEKHWRGRTSPTKLKKELYCWFIRQPTGLEENLIEEAGQRTGFIHAWWSFPGISYDMTASARSCQPRHACTAHPRHTTPATTVHAAAVLPSLGHALKPAWGQPSPFFPWPHPLYGNSIIQAQGGTHWWLLQ